MKRRNKKKNASFIVLEAQGFEPRIPLRSPDSVIFASICLCLFAMRVRRRPTWKPAFVVCG